MWLRETPNAHAGNYLICVVPHENGRSCREQCAERRVQNLHTTIAARLRWCESSGGCAGCAWCFPVRTVRPPAVVGRGVDPTPGCTPGPSGPVACRGRTAGSRR